MKKTYVLITAILIIGAVQTASAEPRTRMGVKAGLVFADQDWEYDNILGSVRRDHRSGFAAGLFIDFPLTTGLGIRPEALYIQRGSQLDVRYMTYDGSDGGTITYDDRIDYLSASISVKVKFGNGPVGLYVFGGPRLDLKVGTSTDSPDANLDRIFDSYRSTVAGISIGFGLENSLGIVGPISLEARFDQDFQEAAEHVGEEATLTIDNQSFAFLVGLAF